MADSNTDPLVLDLPANCVTTTARVFICLSRYGKNIGKFPVTYQETDRASTLRNK